MFRILGKKSKAYVILTVISLSFLTTKAQRWEIGGLLGATNYIGDISKDPNIRQTRAGVNLWVRYNLNRHFSYRAGLGYGRAAANDSLYKSNTLRDLGFRTTIIEFSNIFEFHYNPFGLSHPKNKNSTFYVLSGLNVFYYNPQAYYSGQWIDLRPLGTEGQNLDDGSGQYSKISLSIPVGAGVKYKLTQNWILGFEVGYRYTFTDYLDDISGTYPNLAELRAKSGSTAAVLSDPTSVNSLLGEGRSTKGDMRGDPHLKDWYIFSGVTLSYRFTPIRCWDNRKRKRFNLVD